MLPPDSPRVASLVRHIGAGANRFREESSDQFHPGNYEYGRGPHRREVPPLPIEIAVAIAVGPAAESRWTVGSARSWDLHWASTLGRSCYKLLRGMQVGERRSTRYQGK
jgi:hypothetical protein